MRTFLVIAAWLTLTARAPAAEPPATPPFCALLVGGGPDDASNAAQIEGHLRFAASLVPPAAKRTLLFADGKADRASVSYADTSPDADAERALAVLLADHDADEPILQRAPKLDQPIDGPARLAEFRRALTKAAAPAAKASSPLLLYFAGHGTEDKKEARNTHYDLWNDEELKVRDLADDLAKLPRQVPVLLVMAQCFSGAFADVIFAHADPEGAPVDRDIAGFFSAQRDREAAGCSYATERADYQDFSSYFFGALCGRDRFGDAVTGADYDNDGQVTLHEAFCYALIHDRSADTPVCTSDTFLHRFAFQLTEVIYATPYKEVWQAGTLAQRAVLDALSTQLGLSGEARALAVYDRLAYGDPSTSPALLAAQNDVKSRLRAVREPALAALFERWPTLRWGVYDTGKYREARDGAVADLIKDEKLRATLLQAGKAAEQADEAADNEEAALMRFANLYTHIVEARQLRAEGKPDLKARFERLWKAEQRALPLTAR